MNVNGTSRLSAVLFGILTAAASACFATSAQIEVTDPVLPVIDGTRAHGNVFYGAVVGGGLYDSAGNVGVTIPLAKAGKGHVYFWGDIFTWVKNPSITRFEPKRVVYTIEPGYDYVTENHEFRVFIKHQSFHDPDAANALKESYELYGVDYRRLGSPQLEFRVGYYGSKRRVDYNWDFLASANFDLSKAVGRGVYAEIWLHEVTRADGGNFLDYAGEVGIKIRDGVMIFGRYEYLHDLDHFGGVADHHFLIGPKYSW